MEFIATKAINVPPYWCLTWRLLATGNWVDQWPGVSWAKGGVKSGYIKDMEVDSGDGLLIMAFASCLGPLVFLGFVIYGSLDPWLSICLGRVFFSLQTRFIVGCWTQNWSHLLSYFFSLWLVRVSVPHFAEWEVVFSKVVWGGNECFFTRPPQGQDVPQVRLEYNNTRFNVLAHVFLTDWGLRYVSKAMLKVT